MSRVHLLQCLDLIEVTSDETSKHYLNLVAVRSLNTLLGRPNRQRKKVDSSLVTRSEELEGMNLGKIAAIKMYRARTNCGLGEAKNVLENHFQRKGLSFYYS